MKEGDLILVSAEATGLGKPMEAVIDKIETFMGQTLVTVTYTQPDALSGFGGCCLGKMRQYFIFYRIFVEHSVHWTFTIYEFGHHNIGNNSICTLCFNILIRF